MIMYSNTPLRSKNNNKFNWMSGGVGQKRGFDRLVIEKPIYLSEVYNLRNYIPENEFESFCGLFLNRTEDGRKELDRRIEMYKDYNIGKSKFFISFLVPEITKLVGLSYIINNFSSIILNRKIKFCKPIENKAVRNKDEYVISHLLKRIIEENKSPNSSKRSLVYIKDDLNLYFSYKIGLLDKWLNL